MSCFRQQILEAPANIFDPNLHIFMSVLDKLVVDIILDMEKALVGLNSTQKLNRKLLFELIFLFKK